MMHVQTLMIYMGSGLVFLALGILLGVEIFRFGPMRREAKTRRRNFLRAHREVCEQVKSYYNLVALYESALSKHKGTSREEIRAEFLTRFEGTEFQLPRWSMRDAHNSIERFC
jgi:hypothetical protein